MLIVITLVFIQHNQQNEESRYHTIFDFYFYAMRN